MTLSLARLIPGSLRQWHWISSALCLIGMLGFAITGITLNHAGVIPAVPQVTSVETTVPADLLAQLSEEEDVSSRVPRTLRSWLASEQRIYLPPTKQIEWSEEEIYLAMPQPGADAWLSLDLASGELIYEKTDRGWVAYFNDLHKGRDTGTAWRWFLDVFAVACVVFSMTGLLLLQKQALRRPSTWPMVGLGVLIPLLLILLFIH
ncbi:hypothetical protein IMCC21906_02492 [Spongiibacter sp. IMCC21906]|uniref:PepSY-associated TM helix domain-containing protein n=1 Tax=Spongiibacter sp. IMCC21906 TaxID=1620392 RepID=UPI00062DCCA6|nr:PepSY-associated TM helix domain-containing protein [Spongiibacter sp. IMCC21906]AKH70147.1 hypothetical protein IMCC21906_02492 [Spongiibacter sp. IMCC21906]